MADRNSHVKSVHEGDRRMATGTVLPPQSATFCAVVCFNYGLSDSGEPVITIMSPEEN